MDFIKNFRDIILDTEFKVTILKNKIDIVNYESIDHFDDNKVIIRYKDGEIIIKGKNLVVSRLTIDEALVKGKIFNIELRWLFENKINY